MSVVHAPDVAELTADLEEHSAGADLLVLDGAMDGRSLFTHLRIDEAVPEVCGWEVDRILLTQIGRTAPPHEELVEVVAELCDRAAPAHDGLTVEVGHPERARATGPRPDRWTAASTVACMESFVLTIIGADRAGLVDALSEVVAEHGGNWERSQMTELAGMFAGMVLVRVPPDRAGAFEQALAPLRDRGLMDVTLRPAADEDAAADVPTLSFEVVGADRPGIVHEVSHLLAERDVGIIDLRTWTESASTAGYQLFRAAAVVRLPEDVAVADLTAALEDLSDDLMVDLLDE